jgi:WhiB family redox-sensing transcriptional regulator
VINVLLKPTPAWLDQANCQGTDTNEFYPDKGGDSTIARKICQRCPVRLKCLQAALDRREKHGIWGGLSEHQRTSLLRRRNKQREREARQAYLAQLAQCEHRPEWRQAGGLCGGCGKDDFAEMEKAA